MTRFLTAACVVLAMVPASVAAQLQSVEQSIYGMDWSVCAHAVSVAVRKLEGVQSVDVSLNEGVATVELTAVNSITLEQLRSAIRDQGFSPRETTLTLSAEIQSQGDGFVAVLPGSEVTYSLRGDDRTLADLARAAGSVATLRGVVDRDDETGDTPTTLAVSGLNRQWAMMRIGELARRAGVTADAIRFYEREGLLPSPERSANGYRSYSAAVLEDLSFIRKGRALGLSLAEIREVMSLTANGQVPCDHVRVSLQARLEDVERRMGELGALRATLTEALGRLDDVDTAPGPCRCVVIEGYGWG